MKVKYIHGVKNKWSSNIMWNGYWPMKHGKFPKNHPCHNMGKPMVSVGKQKILVDPGDLTGNDALAKFRARGYEASCFPEGDGITIPFPDRPAEQVIKDIEECFGWEVVG